MSNRWQYGRASLAPEFTEVLWVMPGWSGSPDQWSDWFGAVYWFSTQ